MNIDFITIWGVFFLFVLRLRKLIKIREKKDNTKNEFKEKGINTYVRGGGGEEDLVEM